MAELGNYARGLRQAVSDPAAAWRELAGLAGALATTPDLKRGLIDAAARPEPARGKWLASLLKPCSRPVARLVELLLVDQELDAIPELADAFARELAKEGYARVHLETPAPLNGPAERGILKALKIDPRRALVTYEENEQLLGGVRATVDGRVIDASLGGRLDRVAEAVGGIA